MSILVAGIGKSGTTGLYYLVKNSMPGDPTCAFEPDLDKLTGNEDLIKSLVGDMRPEKNLVKLGAFDQFDKRLFIVRDPRDWIVSAILYSSATSRFSTRADLDEWLKLLKQKDADPSSISLVELRTIPDSPVFRNSYGQVMIECCAKYDHCLVMYEDFVKGLLAEAEEYLGFKLTGKAEVDPKYNRVERSKRAGNWRNWMTPDDVDFFKPVFTKFMDHFGYDIDDWELNNDPVIEPALSSEYVERVWTDFNAWRFK